MQLRTTGSIDSALYNCLAVYETTPLDVLTRKPPIVRADMNTIANNGTAETKLLCGYYAVYIVARDIMATITLFAYKWYEKPILCGKFDKSMKKYWKRK